LPEEDAMVDARKICASDLMSTDLVTIHQETPVAEAIATLEDYHFSGAPVINDLGECVGVFSSADVLKQRREIEEGETPVSGSYFSNDSPTEEGEEGFSREDYDVNVLGLETVGEWMTPQVKSVAPRATVEEVCRRMVTERIHRLLVMEGKRLLGIITCFDIVRLLGGLKSPPKGAGSNGRRLRVKK
jgi:CBS domain-containing protein